MDFHEKLPTADLRQLGLEDHICLQKDPDQAASKSALRPAVEPNSYSKLHFDQVLWLKPTKNI